MLKPKDLSGLTAEKLYETYQQAAVALVMQMGVTIPKVDDEQENAWFDKAEAAWTDIKRCHHQVVLRRGREWAKQRFDEICQKSTQGKE